MDWDLVDAGRLDTLRCPSCQRQLAGGLMRQVEWTSRRCVVVVSCPGCGADCIAILETRSSHPEPLAPIDIGDVRRAHDILGSRDWHVEELFAV